MPKPSRQRLELPAGRLSFDVGSYPVFGHDLTKLADIPSFQAIVHPDDRAQVKADVARAVETDTGHGMSPAVMARVFEPFYTTKALNGTGLGLWISSGIVARHHGSIWIRSSEDPKRRGTVFSLFLPRISEAEIEAATPLA